MRQLFWAEQAEVDIAAILDETAQNDGNEESLLDRITDAPALLLEYPLLGTVVRGSGLRKWLIRQTPFLIFYRTRTDGIEVARVLHRASDWANLA